MNKKQIKILIGFGIGLLLFIIALPFFFSYAIKREVHRNSYTNNVDYYFKGKIIDYEQIRTVNYALLVKYDTLSIKYGENNSDDLFSGVLDTVSKQIIYNSFVYPQGQYDPSKKIDKTEFPDYIIVDGAENRITFYKDSVLYNFFHDKITTLGDYTPSDTKFEEYCKKTGIENGIKF